MYLPVNACNWTTPSSKYSSLFISIFHIGHNRGLVRVKFKGAIWPWYSKVRGEMATNTHWHIWVKTTGNPGSLFVSHMGFITWVNLENRYRVKFRSGNLLENGNRNQWNFPRGELLLSLIRRTESFGKNNLLHLFYICFSSSWNSDMKKKQKCKLCRKDEGDYFSRNFLCILRTTTTRHMVSFINFHFYFRFLANF